MKIVLLNGSGRKESGNSEYFLKCVNEMLVAKGADNIEEYVISKMECDNVKILQALINADILVFAMPVYYSSIPAFVLAFLEMIEKRYYEVKKGLKIYLINNSGYFECHENDMSIEQLKIWSHKFGFSWGQAIAIGAGEMMGKLRKIPLNSGPHVLMGKNMEMFSQNIMEGKSGETLYSVPDKIPKIVFFKEVNKRWDVMIDKGQYFREAFQTNSNI